MSGYTLTELLVALVIFQIGVVGVLGMAVVGSRELATAAELQRAAGAFETVADSLLRSGLAGGAPGGVLEEGTTRRGEWEVRWRAIAGGVLLEVAPLRAEDRIVVAAVLPISREASPMASP